MGAQRKQFRAAKAAGRAYGKTVRPHHSVAGYAAIHTVAHKAAAVSGDPQGVVRTISGVGKRVAQAKGLLP